jgi:hypothetical protein
MMSSIIQELLIDEQYDAISRHGTRRKCSSNMRKSPTISVFSLPESADEILDGAFMNSKIESNMDRIEQIRKWFDDNPSPSNMP